MIKISYDTTGEGRRNDERIFEVMGSVSATSKVKRDPFNPNIIVTYVETKDDARYAEREILNP